MTMYIVSYIEYDVNEGFFKDLRLFSTKKDATAFFQKWINDFEGEGKEIESESEGDGYAHYVWNYGGNELEISITEVETDRKIIHGTDVQYL